MIHRSQEAEPSQQPQLGKLLTADLVLTVELQRKKFDKPEAETDPDEKISYLAISTIVDSQTGTIRGRSVEEFRAVAVDETAVQIARYLRAVIENPKQSGVTLAIGTFESLGRFERLRSIETGLQELMTEELQQMGDFRVVRRRDMQSLNDEFALMRSGLADAAQLPETLPNRSAAFLLRGTIDELNRGQNRQIIVNASLVNALSEKAVYQFQLQAAREKLPKVLSRQLEEVAKKLAAETLISPAEIRRPVHTLEAEDLYLMARRDLERFARKSPINGSPEWFSLPGSPKDPKDRPPLVNADSPLGRHLLLKSIDRLESALYINPELVEAQYSLAFCYSFHLPGVFDPDRSAQLLEQIYKQHPEDEQAVPALWLLSEIQFPHHGRSLAPTDRNAALEHIAYAFENMPPRGRTAQWMWLVEQVYRLSRGKGDEKIALHVIQSGAKLVLETDGRVRESLARKVTRLASLLLTNKRLEPSERDRLQELLVRWTETDTPSLPFAAAHTLAEVAAAEGNHPSAADWYERTADLYDKEHHQQNRILREGFLVKAASQRRIAGQPEAALKLLDRIDSRHRPRGHSYLYGLELGTTLEALDQPDQALKVYLAAAESVPGMTDNTDVLTRIKRLGGVPLREDRDVRVTYVPPPKKQPFLIQKLATDGQRLFCTGSAIRPPAVDIAIYDMTTGVWSQANAEFRGVTCLACNGGPLWVGTVENGIWRYGPQDNSWKQWSSKDGLPDDRVVSFALDGQALYAGVGTASSGGLVKINPDNRISVLDSAGTPRFAPTHIGMDGGQILARTRNAIHRYDRKTGEWSVLKEVKTPNVFSGTSQIWASDLATQIYPFQADGKIDRSYRTAWAPANGLGTNYLVNFVVEQENQIWFGGTALQRFLTTGLYRFGRSTGDFTVYGPRDGMRYVQTFTTYDAVWALDRLWVADEGGLAEMKFRPHE